MSKNLVAVLFLMVSMYAVTAVWGVETKKGPRVSVAPGVELPAEAMVYKFRTTAVTEQRMREMIKLLGLPEPGAAEPSEPGKGRSGRKGGIRISNLGGSYSLPDKHLSLTLGSDGTVFFNSSAPEEEAPCDAEAIAVAKAFLKRSGLIPAGAELQLIGVGGEGLEEFDGDGKRTLSLMLTRTPGFWIVRPDKTLEGSMVDVGVCAGGKICDLTLCMRTLEPGEKRPVRDRSELEAAVVGELKSYVYPQESMRAADVFPVTAPDAEVLIESCRVAYVEPFFLENARYAEPQYVVTGKATSKGREWPFTFRIPALKAKFTPTVNATPGVRRSTIVERRQ